MQWYFFKIKHKKTKVNKIFYLHQNILWKPKVKMYYVCSFRLICNSQKNTIHTVKLSENTECVLSIKQKALCFTDRNTVVPILVQRVPVHFLLENIFVSVTLKQMT